jgi:hypothetical protein
MKTVTRTLLVVAAVVWVATASPLAARQSADKKVDALTLALAVRAGTAKQYVGYTVTGQGRSFDANCVPADPAKKVDASIPLALASLGKDGKPQPIVTLEEWVNFQMVGRPVLLVNLRGPKLQIKPEPDPQRPVLYSFTGVFNGETESVTPPASIMDNNPKPFVVAVLRDATAR